MADTKKIAKLVNTLDKFRKICVFVVMGAVYSIVFTIFGISIDSFIGAAIISWILNFVAVSIAVIYYQKKILGSDVSSDELLDDLRNKVDAIIDDMEEDEGPALKSSGEQVTPQTLKFTVLAVPETPVGKFMDHDIFEWIDIVDTAGTKYRCFFTGTMNLSSGKTFTIPAKSFVLPPGIIYQVEGL